MTDQELLTRAKELQKEAMRVIQSLDVLDIIRKISESEIVGSAKSGLIMLDGSRDERRAWSP